MSGKHFIMKRIVVPLLTLIMVCGMTVSAFAAETGSYDIAASNPNITICYAVDNSRVDTGTVVTPVGKQDIEVGDIQGEVSVSRLGVDGLKYSLDQTFGVTRYNDVAIGVPFNSGHTLYEGLNNKQFMQMYNSNKKEVIQAVRDAYPSETNQWYDEYIALPIYYGVLNGYEDGTLQPNRHVAVSEVAKIVATAYESNLRSGGILHNPNLDGKWYNNYYNTMAKAFTYKKSGNLTPLYMDSNMKRCEVAYVLANVCDDGTLKEYIAKAEKGDISQMAGYVDFVNIENTPQYLESEQSAMYNGKIPARFAGAVMYLQAKGIMVGDGAGHINPLDNVTRAEVFKLIQTTCQNTASYTSNKFHGWETRTQGGEVHTPVQSTMTEETVLNPNAPTELQYKVNDISESSYKYIISGQANIAEKTLKKEYTERIARVVVNSIQVNGDKITFTLPDLKSDYHEIQVGYVVYGIGGSNESYYSSQNSGTITVAKKDGAEIEVRVMGRKDKGRPASSSLVVTYDVDSGAISVN